MQLTLRIDSQGASYEGLLERRAHKLVTRSGMSENLEMDIEPEEVDEGGHDDECECP